MRQFLRIQRILTLVIKQVLDVPGKAGGLKDHVSLVRNWRICWSEGVFNMCVTDATYHEDSFVFKTES